MKLKWRKDGDEWVAPLGQANWRAWQPTPDGCWRLWLCFPSGDALISSEIDGLFLSPGEAKQRAQRLSNLILSNESDQR